MKEYQKSASESIEELPIVWGRDGKVLPPDPHENDLLAFPSGPGGACPSITPPQNSQAVNHADTPSESPRKVWGSEDMFCINFYCTIGETQEDFEILMSELESARLRAQESAKPDIFTWKGQKWAISGRGCSIGGPTGTFVNYVLQGEGINLYVAAARVPRGWNFNVRAAAGSEVLMLHDGAPKVYERIRKWFKLLGMRVQNEQISRMDLAVEVAVPVATFATKFYEGAVVSRFKRSALYRSVQGVVEGFSCGTGPLMMRVYDKRKELRDSKADSKAEIMASRRAGFGEDCTRVEFQLRGEFLKKYDIRTFADWMFKRGALMDYLTIYHTRLVDEVGDRSHTSRVMPSDSWLQVIRAFQAVCSGEKSEEPIQRVVRSGAKVWDLAKQAFGCLVSAVALQQNSQGVERVEGGEALNIMAGFISSAAEGRELSEWVGERLEYFRIAEPSRAVWFSPDGYGIEEPDFCT